MNDISSAIHRHAGVRRCRRAPAALAALAVLAGCSALEPCDHRDLRGRLGLACVLVGMREEPERDVRGCLIGSVAAAEPTDAPIVVFVYRPEGNGVEVIESAVLARSDHYAFTVPAGAYRIGAFADRDRDLRYDPTREVGTLYHDGRSVTVTPGQRVDRLYLTLHGDQSQRIGFELTVPATRRAHGDGHSSRTDCFRTPGASSQISGMRRDEPADAAGTRL